MCLKTTGIFGVAALMGLAFAGAGCDKQVVKAKPTAVAVKNGSGAEAVIVDAPEAKEDRELGERGAKLLRSACLGAG